MVDQPKNDPPKEANHNKFDMLVRDLHDQFMRGELSQGGMAAELGINRVELIHLLEALGLQVTNL